MMMINRGGWAAWAGLWIVLMGGTLNAQGTGQVEDTKFSFNRGFYNAPFQLEITTATAGATIKYTTNGNTPSSTSGSTYSGPISISKTTVVRAMALKSGLTPTDVDTHTYIFTADVIRQPRTISGYPQPTFSTRDRNGNTRTLTLDYEMDPNIVNDGAYSGKIRSGFTKIPSICFAARPSDFFNVYASTSDDTRTVVSLEYINPDDPSKNAQITCRLAPHSHHVLGRSLRVAFTSAVGDPKWNCDLFQDSPLVGDSATDSHDDIVFRMGANRNYTTRWNPDKIAMSREPWVQTSQIEMSGYGLHIQRVHVWVNGLYWGVYKATERPQAGYQEEYFGGSKSDYFTINHGGPQDGSATRWNYLKGALKDKNMANASNYNELKGYLDVSDFCDYLILNWYAGTSDWPQNNWWGAMRTSPPGKMRFFCWDADDCWDGNASAGPGYPTSGGRGSNGAWVSPTFRPGGNNSNSRYAISHIWHSARRNSDFMMLFADRVYRHCFNGGAITDGNSRSRWKTLTDFYRPAAVADCARWGDARESMGEPFVPSGDRLLRITRHPDAQFEREAKRVYDRMSGNVSRFITALRRDSYYPSIHPPTFSPHGGAVAAGFRLTITKSGSASGDIYFTLDGNDPRASGGGVSGRAVKYTGSVALSGTVAVRTRFRTSGGEWSAMNEAVFVVGSGQNYAGLRITEVMYNPPDQGTIDGDDFEFVELKNVSGSTIALSGVTFGDGIEYAFPPGATIAPGSFIVLASNAVRFKSKYGFDPYDEYRQGLSNGGETLALADPLGNIFREFTYNDKAPWPTDPDGGGHSLVPADPAGGGDLNLPGSWRSSANPGGSPGEDDPASTGGGGGPPPPTPVTVTFQDGAGGYAGTLDTYLSQSNPGTTYGGAATIRVDGDDPNGTQNDIVGLIRFDLSSLPSNARVDGATFTINITNPTNDRYVLQALLRSFSEADADWGMADASAAWGAGGAGGSADRDVTELGAVTPTSTGTYAVTLNAAGLALLETWINDPSLNFGFVIGGSANTDGMAFSSRESGSTAARPKLTITYTPGAGGGGGGGGGSGGGSGGGGGGSSGGCGATGFEVLLPFLFMAIRRRREGSA